MSPIEHSLVQRHPKGEDTTHMQRFLTSFTALLICLLLGTSCSSTSPVTLSTAPAGAAVWVNGQHSGFYTPCIISLDKDENHVVEVELDGYDSARRFIVNDPDYETLLWREMSVLPKTWRFPLWLNLEDFFMPVKKTYLLKPSRIFVRMNRTGDN